MQKGTVASTYTISDMSDKTIIISHLRRLDQFCGSSDASRSSWTVKAAVGELTAKTPELGENSAAPAGVLPESAGFMIAIRRVVAG